MKKIATGKRIAVIVRRACPLEVRSTPKGKLWLSVIEQALAEADKKKNNESARRFLASDGFRVVLELLGIDPDFVSELIRDHAAWMRIDAA